MRLTSQTTNAVTLNLFQGPSLRLRRSVVWQQGRAARVFPHSSVLGARWMLKQVQHDKHVWVRRSVKRLVLPLLLFPLVGCNPAKDSAVNACEIFIKSRLRSPSTYKSAAVDFSNIQFESEGRNVKMVSIDYDAANAYGTPVRGHQQCLFEVNATGEYVQEPDSAANIASIGAEGEYAPCCLGSKQSDKAKMNADEAVKDAADAADKAVSEAKAAISEAAKASRNSSDAVSH